MNNMDNMTKYLKQYAMESSEEAIIKINIPDIIIVFEHEHGYQREPLRDIIQWLCDKLAQADTSCDKIINGKHPACEVCEYNSEKQLEE